VTVLASSPIVLFLGAGATAPLGKMLMREFVATLSSKSDFSDNPLFEEITKKDADLEFLLEELQDLERKSYLKDRDGVGSEISTRPRGTRVESFPAVGLSSNWYSRNASVLRRRVEQEVYHAYKSFGSASERKIKKHFKSLFDLIGKSLKPGVPMIVFTTNYDPAIELLCEQCPREYALIDGFEPDSVRRDFIWSPHAFEGLSQDPDGRRLVILLKLHGSTNWFTNGTRIIRGPHIFAGEGQDHHNVLIYPAKRKVAIEEPFFTAYFCLHEMLAHARCLLSVGYS
jgi:hypothetical protein